MCTNRVETTSPLLVLDDVSKQDDQIGCLWIRRTGRIVRSFIDPQGEDFVKKSQVLRLFAVLLAFTMLAAACGSSSDDNADENGDEATETDAGADEAGGVDSEAAEEAVASAEEDDEPVDDSGSAEDPQNIEELEAAWALQRQPVIDELSAKIESGDYGVGDDKILRGPGGFEVDLNDCPADWSDTEGIGDTIKIGHTTALSGNLAAYGNIGAGWEAYIGYVNDTHGGIGGIPMELIIKDDAYVATQTIELVDELIQSDRPFMINTLGSPNTLAVYDTLNANCIPQPFVMTGHPAWGDPVNHPWTSGLQLNYATEAILWGAWIKTNLADELPVKVAGLVMDNDFGLAYEQGFEKYAEENPDVVSEFEPIRHDPAAPTVTNEMTTIASGDPDVFISMTAGNPCLLAVEEAGRSGLVDAGTVLFAPSVCKDPNAYMIPAGDVADGWNVVGGGLRATTDAQWADDPYIKWANEEMAARGLDITVGLYGDGFAWRGWVTTETFRIANELPGGLTRTNYMLALRGLSLDHPILYEGISLEANGAEDGYFVEGSEFSVYDAASETWERSGSVIDLNGSSPNCVWGDTGC